MNRQTDTQETIVLPKKDNDIYSTDSERSTEKSTHNEYVDDILSFDSKFSPQDIIAQSKKIEKSLQ